MKGNTVLTWRAETCDTPPAPAGGRLTDSTDRLTPVGTYADCGGIGNGILPGVSNCTCATCRDIDATLREILIDSLFPRI
jgi:hypothetical protein